MQDLTESLRKLSGDLNTEFDAEVASAGSDDTLSDASLIRVPTSSHMLNLLLGGGIAVGRIIEIFGDPSHGKSTLVEHMMIGFQRYPGLSVHLDSEAAWDRSRAVAMGHSSARNLSLKADTVELGFSVIDSVIKRIRMPGSKFPPDMPVGFFWDTIAASQTEGEKTGDIYKDGMADKARKIRMALRRLSLVLPTTKCSLVFVNQTIQEFGAKKPRKTTPGGSAIKFWSSQRLSVWSGQLMHYPSSNTGIIANVRTVKDKLNPPHQEISLPIRYKTGVDSFYEVLNFLIDNSDFVNISGGRVSVTDYPEEGDVFKLGYQKEAYKKLESDPFLLDYLRVCADAVWAEKFG